MVDLSARAGHFGVLSIQYKKVYSETITRIEFKFHVKTPYDKLVNIFTNRFGHMAKMADTPIYG